MLPVGTISAAGGTTSSVTWLDRLFDSLTLQQGDFDRDGQIERICRSDKPIGDRRTGQYL